MVKMLNQVFIIMEAILEYVLKYLYSYMTQCTIFGVMATIVVLYFRREGVKKGLMIWWEEIKKTRTFFLRFLFFAYSYFLASVTLFNRQMVWDSTGKIFDGWWNFAEENAFVNREVIGNIVLFIPFIYLLYGAWQEKLQKNTIMANVIKSIYISFACSLFIEMNQMIFRVGTFQISDLTYNTIGGIIGCMMWIIAEKIQKKY